MALQDLQAMALARGYRIRIYDILVMCGRQLAT
jgi:hypothetical protein